jgi:hypothetical protein
MKPTNRATGILSLLVASIVCVAVLAPVAHGQDAPPGKSKQEAPPLLRQMVGTWDVQQRMWPGPGAQATNLPPAVARRRLVEGAYLEEIMELAKKSEKDSFTRAAYFNYNAVSRQYEYFSLDSRAPQQMRYESEKRDTRATGTVKLKGGIFVASKWGETTNVAFKYRLEVGEVEKKRQVVRLYLTPRSGESTKEFLAFEYVYTLQR